jgi:hypothetical protein
MYERGYVRSSQETGFLTIRCVPRQLNWIRTTIPSFCTTTGFLWPVSGEGHIEVLNVFLVVPAGVGRVLVQIRDRDLFHVHGVCLSFAHTE